MSSFFERLEQHYHYHSDSDSSANIDDVSMSSSCIFEEAQSRVVEKVVIPMIRSSLKRKLCEDGIGCELNEKHDKIVSAIVDSSLRHISLSSLFSSLEEGLEMVDMGTVLNSDNADKHRPAYLHPYDDGDLSDALKSSLVQAKAVAKTKDNEEEQRRREVQNLVNAEVATGISTYIYTQPDGEEVYVVRFDVYPSKEEPASTYYAFLELVSVDDDTSEPWVGVRFGAHTAPEFVDVKGIANEMLGEEGIADTKDPEVKTKITNFCWEVYKRLWAYEARRSVGERLLASGGEEGGLKGLHDKPWELVSFLIPGSISTELKFAFDEPTSKLPTRVKVEFFKDDELVQQGEEEKAHKASIGKLCKEAGLEGVEKVVTYCNERMGGGGDETA